VRSEDLQSHDKWLNWFNRNKPTVQRGRAVQLKYYGHFKRGIATGANKFFVLNRSQAQQLGLPSGECVPCISRSAQLTRPIADDQTVQALSDRGENMLLFTAGHDPSDSALAYIRWGEQLGVNRRFLTRHRTPWYKTEDRVSAPILMGVFSRGGYKVILNRSRALNLTCFHGFYPNLFGSPYVIHLFLYLLSRTGRNVLSLAMRNYGDALDKFEPNDLNGALVPAPEVFAAITNIHISKELDHVEHCGVVTDQLEEIFESMMKGHLADRGSVVGVS
jgi:adenine-specific DNA-methyltransferase